MAVEVHVVGLERYCVFSERPVEKCVSTIAFVVTLGVADEADRNDFFLAEIRPLIHVAFFRVENVVLETAGDSRRIPRAGGRAQRRLLKGGAASKATEDS